MAAPNVVGLRHSGVYEGVTTSSYSFQLNQAVQSGRYLYIRVFCKPLFSGGSEAEAQEYATGLRLRINKNGRPLKVLGHVAQTNSVENFHWLFRLGEDISAADIITLQAKGGWNTDVYVCLVHELQASSGKVIVPAYIKENDERGSMPNNIPRARAEPLPAGVSRLWFRDLGYRETPKTLTADSRFSNPISIGSTAKAPATANVSVHSGYYIGTDTDLLVDETLSAAVWWESVLIAFEEVDDPGPSAPYLVSMHETYYAKTEPPGNAYIAGDIKLGDGQADDALVVFLTTDTGTNKEPPAGLALLNKINTGGCSLYVWMRRYTDVPELSSSNQPERYTFDQTNLGAQGVWTATTLRFPGSSPWTVRSSGTATGGSTSTLVDSGKDFVALGVQVGDYVEIGPNAAQTAIVASVSATTLTFSQTLGIAVSTGDAYVVRKNPLTAYVQAASINPRSIPAQAPAQIPSLYLFGAFANTSIGQDDNAWSAAPAVDNGSYMLVENGAAWANFKAFYGWKTTSNPVNASLTFQPGRDQVNAGTPTPTDGAGHTLLVFAAPVATTSALSLASTSLRAKGQTVVLSQTHLLAVASGALAARGQGVAVSQSHLLQLAVSVLRAKGQGIALAQTHLIALQSVPLHTKGGGR
ncbi:hypothetical protein EWH23_00985 [Meiothermus sp. PNK-Is4]|uniref:hypothetical protein n=1 Tax=Meiothermus sp. PNK-Is4 TaxID=2740565 RepID=UPI00101F3BCB|nr:hypothetical protein [Meiothermus sp. PNK-Is4]RYM40730.1 hypothetical protein EWH23_00985 [Meiothermus sp. PNK-Is4]